MKAPTSHYRCGPRKCYQKVFFKNSFIRKSVFYPTTDELSYLPVIIHCCVNDYTHYFINPEELLTFHLCVCSKAKQAAPRIQQSASSLHSNSTFTHLRTGNSFSPASVDLCGLSLRSTAEGLERFGAE